MAAALCISRSSPWAGRRLSRSTGRGKHCWSRSRPRALESKNHWRSTTLPSPERFPPVPSSGAAYCWKNRRRFWERFGLTPQMIQILQEPLRNKIDAAYFSLIPTKELSFRARSHSEERSDEESGFPRLGEEPRLLAPITTNAGSLEFPAAGLD